MGTLMAPLESNTSPWMVVKRWDVGEIPCLLVRRWLELPVSLLEHLPADGSADRDTPSGLSRPSALEWYTGYVRVPESLQVLEALGTQEIEVYGGITYGPDGSGWIGWDSHHGAEFASPSQEVQRAEEITTELAAQVTALSSES